MGALLFGVASTATCTSHLAHKVSFTQRTLNNLLKGKSAYLGPNDPPFTWPLNTRAQTYHGRRTKDYLVSINKYIFFILDLRQDAPTWPLNKYAQTYTGNFNTVSNKVFLRKIDTIR